MSPSWPGVSLMLLLLLSTTVPLSNALVVVRPGGAPPSIKALLRPTTTTTSTTTTTTTPRPTSALSAHGMPPLEDWAGPTDMTLFSTPFVLLLMLLLDPSATTAGTSPTIAAWTTTKTFSGSLPMPAVISSIAAASSLLAMTRNTSDNDSDNHNGNNNNSGDRIDEKPALDHSPNLQHEMEARQVFENDAEQLQQLQQDSMDFDSVPPAFQDDGTTMTVMLEEPAEEPFLLVPTNGNDSTTTSTTASSSLDTPSASMATAASSASLAAPLTEASPQAQQLHQLARQVASTVEKTRVMEQTAWEHQQQQLLATNRDLQRRDISLRKKNGNDIGTTSNNNSNGYNRGTNLVPMSAVSSASTLHSSLVRSSKTAPPPILQQPQVLQEQSPTRARPGSMFRSSNGSTATTNSNHAEPDREATTIRRRPGTMYRSSSSSSSSSSQINPQVNPAEDVGDATTTLVSMIPVQEQALQQQNEDASPEHAMTRSSEDKRPAWLIPTTNSHGGTMTDNDRDEDEDPMTAMIVEPPLQPPAQQQYSSKTTTSLRKYNLGEISALTRRQRLKQASQKVANAAVGVLQRIQGKKRKS